MPHDTQDVTSADIAETYKALTEAEQTASKLEQMLDAIDAKVDGLMSSEDLKELEDFLAARSEEIASKK